MKSSSERQYERLLRWYPRWWRDTHGRVVLATLLDVDDARGRTGPTPKEAWGLRLDGLRNRWRSIVSGHEDRDGHPTAARRPWVGATAALGAASLLTLAIGGWAVANTPDGQLTEARGDRTLDALLQDASDYEREILVDGVVTFAEYEQALLDWRGCVAAAGAEPGEIYPIGENELTFDYEFTAANDAARVELEDSAETCLPDYFNNVAAWWVEQQPQIARHAPLAAG